jgi:hypothetical protein
MLIYGQWLRIILSQLMRADVGLAFLDHDESFT